ncbi:MAG TPA: exonuclease domain-containing protein [Ktedonobacterales bacterium]
MPSQPVSPGPHSGPRTLPPPVRVALDLETTGLNADTDAIIEIGAVKFAGHRVLDRLETLVAPNAPLPYRIQRLTGITPATLRSAPALAAVLNRLRPFVGEAPLVGHNVAFDAAFLRRVGLFSRNPLIDTYELASMLLPALPSYSLASVGDALGLHRDESHRALADADLSRRVFLALVERLRALESGAIEDLLALPASRDWTPSHLLRQELRGRDAHMGNVFAGVLTTSLGGQFASSLGVHPGALALAGPSPAPVEPADGPPLPASEGRRRAVGTHILPVLQSGGTLLLEIEHDVDGLAACVEAALEWAARTDERLVIAVADAEMVRRLTRDVLPVARAALNGSGHTLQLAEIAQRGAYLCLWRWFGVARAPDAAIPSETSRGLSKLIVWSRTTTTGMRADVALSGQEQQAWERVRAGREYTESAATCPYGKGGYCFLTAAQNAAGDAQVVVTTHAALAAQLAGTDDLLPDATRVLVLDAHLFEEALRETRSLAIDRARLRDLLDGLADSGRNGRIGLLHSAAVLLDGAAGRTGAKQAAERAWFEQVAVARRCVDEFFTALQALFARTDARNKATGNAPADTEQRVLLIDDDLRRSAAWRHATATWHQLATHLKSVASAARDIAARVQAIERKAPGSGSGVPLELLGVAAQLELLTAGVDRVVAEAENGTPGIVSWLRVPYANQNDRGGGQRSGGASAHSQQPRQGPLSGSMRPAEADGDAPRSDVANATRIDGLGDNPSDIEGDSHGRLPAVKALTRQNVNPAREELPVLHSAAISVDELVAPLTARNHSLVLAGPSLSVAGDFEYVRGSLRLPESTSVASLTADRDHQTLLCLPSDVPEPNAPRYQRSLEETLIQLATALDGRLVALFPSHAALRSAYSGIRRALETKNILVLGQGQDGSVRQLWQSFATEQRIVLLGAGAFWDGSMLRRHPPACVVVTKLPFPAMSDPLLAARAAQWDDAQRQFVVPQAALKLRQALSGLAWSHNQRNAVVLFDRRVQTRGYGALVVGSLPRCSQYEEPVDALTERIAEWVGPA